MHLIDGKAIADAIQKRIAGSISTLSHRKPGLAFVLVGNDPASETYIRMKKKRCKEVGILSFDCELPNSISEKQLLDEIQKLNKNPAIDGILVQLPLPEHINAMNIVSAVDPAKDVDGFHPKCGQNALSEKMTDSFLARLTASRSCSARHKSLSMANTSSSSEEATSSASRSQLF